MIDTDVVLPAFELAVQDIHGLSVAARLPVDRIELCAALAVGGLTPSLGLVEAAAGTPGIPPVHVLVRPRPGGFDYDAEECDLIVRDVRHVLSAGAHGVVIGGVRGDRIDTDLLKRIIEEAGGADVTFHRAFDTLPDPASALDLLATSGVRRVLTSAGADAVGHALPALASLVRAAAGGIEIMAGGGVHPELVPDLVATGVAAIHASAKRTVADTVTVGLGTAAPAGAPTRETTDEAQVERILAALGR
ncbi:copper homeostasis protein CutC [Actinoplanes sp. NPDC023714]|uniref:copper homeostasis protein CutC n=1 Tax=Actinoplanes sp. NPDC023714 TaxID=3154322 RepID=UPI00340ED80C